MGVHFFRNGIVFNLLLWTSLCALTAQAGQEESCNGAQVGDFQLDLLQMRWKDETSC